MVPAPENIKTDHPVPPRLGMEPHNFPACPEMVWTDINQHLDIYAGHSPQDAYTETLQESVEASLPFFILTKGYIASFIRIKNKDTSFQSTPHDITIKKEESHD